jgi:hypothetical protein
MDVRLIIFSSKRRTYQVRIWSDTEPTRNWAKRYGSKSACMAELLRLELLPTQQALDEPAVSREKSKADVIALQAKTQRDLLVASGFSEQKRTLIPCFSRINRERGAGCLDWLP